MRNEKLEKENIDQKSLLTKLTLDLKDTESVNVTLGNKRKEIEQSIEECNINVAKSVEAVSTMFNWLYSQNII